jgi:outer membrane lipopolysaccharide assembly protein LptE/RlpB
MPEGRTTADRLTAYSDAVFAVIVTIIHHSRSRIVRNSEVYLLSPLLCENEFSMSRVGLAALAACLLLITGCGYHTAGSAAHLPNTVHMLAVPVFQNETQSYHTEVAFTQAVIKEFSSRTSYHTVPGNDPDADATLNATITNFQVIPLTYNSQTGQSSSFLVTIRARVVMTDRNHKVLFQNSSYLFRQQYETTEDLVTFIQEDPSAVDRLSRDFAHAVVSDILESF